MAEPRQTASKEKDNGSFHRDAASLSVPLQREELCVATTADGLAVMEMCGDVYSGLDYLQSTFSHLVEGLGVQGFLYKVDGELVAFVSTQLVDEGRCLMMKAARVRPSVQGGGVYGRFRHSVLRLFRDRQRFPDLEREAATLNRLNTQERSEAMLKSGWRLVETKHSPITVFKASSLSTLSAGPLPLNVQPVSKDDLRDLLVADISCWKHLFPHQRMIVAWAPFAAIPADLEHVFKSSNVQFYGTWATGESLRDCTRGPELLLLTAGSYYKCQLGISYSVDVFGEVQDEDARILGHLQVHLQRLQQMDHLRDLVVFNVFAGEKLERSVAWATAELNASTLDSLSTHDTLHLWERSLTVQP